MIIILEMSRQTSKQTNNCEESNPLLTSMLDHPLLAASHLTCLTHTTCLNVQVCTFATKVSNYHTAAAVVVINNEDSLFVMGNPFIPSLSLKIILSAFPIPFGVAYLHV